MLSRLLCSDNASRTGVFFILDCISCGGIDLNTNIFIAPEVRSYPYRPLRTEFSRTVKVILGAQRLVPCKSVVEDAAILHLSALEQPHPIRLWAVQVDVYQLTVLSPSTQYYQLCHKLKAKNVPTRQRCLASGEQHQHHSCAASVGLILSPIGRAGTVKITSHGGV